MRTLSGLKSLREGGREGQREGRRERGMTKAESERKNTKMKD